MTPLFLFAAFAQVLVAKDGYLKLIRTYALGAIGLYLLFLVVYLHFGVGTLRVISGDYKSALEQMNTLMLLATSSGTLSFNIFIDLLLCALITFFLNYHPTKHFQGKKIIIFRLLVILPIAYDIASITIRLLASAGAFVVSPFIFPLLTTKPPVAFLIFIVLALFVKNREKFYIKHGKTHAEYKEFLNTNVNRYHFAKFLAFTIIGAVILDLILFFVIYIFKVAIVASELPEEYLPLVMQTQLDATRDLGFGMCTPMILLLPIIFFFDYTKTYKNKNVDIIIPVAAVAIIILLFIEGFYEVFKAYAKEWLGKLSDLGDDETEASLISPLATYFRTRIRK